MNNIAVKAKSNDTKPSEPGRYNIYFDGVRTMLPIFTDFDGENWTFQGIAKSFKGMGRQCYWFPNEPEPTNSTDFRALSAHTASENTKLYHYLKHCYRKEPQVLAKVEAHRAHMDQLPEFMSLLAQAIGKHSAYEEQEIYPLYQPKKGKHP